MAFPEVLGLVAIMTSFNSELILFKSLSKDKSDGPIPSNGEIAPPRHDIIHQNYWCFQFL